MSTQEKSSPVLVVEGSSRISDSELRRSGSFGQTNSATSSIRRRSMSLLGAQRSHTDNDIDSEDVSEAGDIGDRALHSNRYSRSSSLRFSFDHALESGAVVPISDDAQFQSHEFWACEAVESKSVSPVSPLPEEIASPLSNAGAVKAEEKLKDNKTVLPNWIEYGSCLVHLAVFGIFGVMTRYLLQRLFGPGVAGVTSNQSILYLDLPSNMVGSFLMGWFGVVFKSDIARVSDFLAIGLSTGYLGSLTTFSSWNQKMLDLSVEGHWVSAVLGFLLGLFLAAYSIIFGVETARGFKWLLERRKSNTESSITNSTSSWRVDSFKRHVAVMLVFLLMLGLLWSVSGVMEGRKFNSYSSEAQLWLGCIVGPAGVWMRWFLARLNGRGLGSKGLLKWVPFGTLIANVSAACFMAALATIKKMMNIEKCDTVATGIQLGFLGCLSTVSTFIAEFNAMRESKYPWRAYAYAMATICISFGLGTLIYSVPVWTKE